MKTIHPYDPRLAELPRVLANTARALRLEAGLTQGQLEARTRIHRPIIARIESGRAGHLPQVETLDRFARGCGQRGIGRFLLAVDRHLGLLDTYIGTDERDRGAR